MTSTPNNIAGESWEKEFDSEIGGMIFHGNTLYGSCPDCKYLGIEIKEDDITVGELFCIPAIKAFIHKTRQDAIAEHDAKWHPINMSKMEMENLHYVQEAIAGDRGSCLKEALSKLPRKFWEDEDHAVGGYISKKDLYELLTPNSTTSKWEGHIGTNCPKCNLMICQRIVEEEEQRAREISQEN
jgi:hypothetical protein